MKLHLLLARAGEGRPALAEPLPLEAAANAPAPVALPEPTDLTDLFAEPDSLPRQRWALVVPQGPEGARLADILAPLRRWREEEQGGAAEVIRVPHGMNAEVARRFREEEMQPTSRSGLRHARYVLLAGDPDLVSPELQEELLADGTAFVGRLSFEDEQDYEAYAAKVVERERRAKRMGSARAVFLSVQDGSLETEVGREFLVEPVARACRQDSEEGLFPAGELVEDVVPAGALEALQRHAADPRPGVLFTMSHGLGAPRDGWSDAGAQRRQQGRMYLGANVELTPDVVRHQPFMPGGLWFYFACFGGGTPRRSLYLPWMERLRRDGTLSDAGLQGAMASQPVDGRPFVGALAQAALANPEGPLAVVAHQDLAWSYAFHDAQAGVTHSDRFVTALAGLVQGHRAGVAVNTLTRSALGVDAQLRRHYQAQEDARFVGRPPPEDTLHHAQLWMERHDLASYVLLGDPATRMDARGE